MSCRSSTVVPVDRGQEAGGGAGQVSVGDSMDTISDVFMVEALGRVPFGLVSLNVSVFFHVARGKQMSD